MLRTFAAIAVGAAALTAQAAPLDIAIINGRAVQPGRADLAPIEIGIRGGKIAAAGPKLDPGLSKGAKHVIDAGGKVVSPGFIDVHSHGLETLTRPQLRTADALLAQGVTTIVGNPDGGGPTDLATQAAALTTDGGIGVNVALLIGHGSVRSAVIGGDNRAPTAGELTRMTAIVKQAVADGAFGLSSGIFYTPGRYAKTDELVALARAAGGVYTSHIRDEGNYDAGVVASVDEVIQVAEGAHVTGIVSHMKALGPDSWGKSKTLIEHIDAARKRGVSVFADQYPYEASSTSLSAAVLPGVSATDVRTRMADTVKKTTLLADAKENIRRRGGPHSIAIASAKDSTLNGKRLDDIAAAKRITPEQAAIDIILEGGASIVSFNMHEDDIRAIMRQPWTMTSSDGGLSLPGAGVPHPRNNGAFTRKLAVYVRERKVVSLSDALTSMTTLPGTVFGFAAGRGTLQIGSAADIAIFDPAAVIDRATYENPHQLATGMSCVIVNGQVAWADGKGTGVRTGQVLRRK